MRSTASVGLRDPGQRRGLHATPRARTGNMSRRKWPRLQVRHIILDHAGYIVHIQGGWFRNFRRGRTAACARGRVEAHRLERLSNPLEPRNISSLPTYILRIRVFSGSRPFFARSIDFLFMGSGSIKDLEVLRGPAIFVHQLLPELNQQHARKS